MADVAGPLDDDAMASHRTDDLAPASTFKPKPLATYTALKQAIDSAFGSADDNNNIDKDKPEASQTRQQLNELLDAFYDENIKNPDKLNPGSVTEFHHQFLNHIDAAIQYNPDKGGSRLSSYLHFNGSERPDFANESYEHYADRFLSGRHISGYHRRRGHDYDENKGAKKWEAGVNNFGDLMHSLDGFTNVCLMASEGINPEELIDRTANARRNAERLKHSLKLDPFGKAKRTYNPLTWTYPRPISQFLEKEREKAVLQALKKESDELNKIWQRISSSSLSDTEKHIEFMDTCHQRMQNDMGDVLGAMHGLSKAPDGAWRLTMALENNARAVGWIAKTIAAMGSKSVVGSNLTQAQARELLRASTQSLFDDRQPSFTAEVKSLRTTGFKKKGMTSEVSLRMDLVKIATQIKKEMTEANHGIEPNGEALYLKVREEISTQATKKIYSNLVSDKLNTDEASKQNILTARQSLATKAGRTAVDNNLQETVKPYTYNEALKLLEYLKEQAPEGLELNPEDEELSLDTPGAPGRDDIDDPSTVIVNPVYDMASPTPTDPPLVHATATGGAPGEVSRANPGYSMADPTLITETASPSPDNPDPDAPTYHTMSPGAALNPDQVIAPYHRLDPTTRSPASVAGSDPTPTEASPLVSQARTAADHVGAPEFVATVDADTDPKAGLTSTVEHRTSTSATPQHKPDS